MADNKNPTATDKSTEKAATAAAVKKSTSKKLIARVALKGDFDAQDGFGSAMQEIQAGKPFTTDDAKLAKQLIEQGYAKSAKDADKEEDEALAGSGSVPPKVETTGN